ncbi:MAG: hypothetical protein QXT26_06705 [Thermoproteota archaeon]
MGLIAEFEVRALLATLLTLGLIIGVFYCILEKDTELLKEFVGSYGPFAMAALAFYFSAKGVERRVEK